MSGVYGPGIAAFPDVFPKETREEAESARFARKNAPPFLVTWGDGDPVNIRIGGRALSISLGAKSLEAKGRGHVTIVTKIGSEGDELTEAVARFVGGRQREL